MVSLSSAASLLERCTQQLAQGEQRGERGAEEYSGDGIRVVAQADRAGHVVSDPCAVARDQPDTETGDDRYDDIDREFYVEGGGDA